VGDVQASIQRIREINERRAQARGHLNELGALEDLYAAYQPIVKRKQLARNEWDMALAAQFKADPALKSEPGSRRAAFAHLHCLVLIHLYGGDYQAALNALQRRIALAETSVFLQEDHPLEYLNDLLRLGGLQLHFGQFAVVERLLAQMQAFQAQAGLHSMETFERYYTLWLGLIAAKKEPHRLQAVYGEIQDGLEQFAGLMSPASLMSMLASLARLQFEAGRFSDARVLLERLLAISADGIREDLRSLARILLVMVYAEKGDSDLTESASKAARKFLARREQLFGFERRLLQHFERSGTWADAKEEWKALDSLRADLRVIFENPLEAHVEAMFDFQGWIEGRMAKLRA
jgi:hypothetical protein